MRSLRANIQIEGGERIHGIVTVNAAVDSD